jgi:hypothetical protein
MLWDFLFDDYQKVSDFKFKYSTNTATIFSGPLKVKNVMVAHKNSTSYNIDMSDRWERERKWNRYIRKYINKHV